MNGTSFRGGTNLQPFSSLESGPSTPPTLRPRRLPSFRKGLDQPLSPAQIAQAARGPRKPLEGEQPAGRIRVRIVKGDGLVIKDRNGTSDP